MFRKQTDSELRALTDVAGYGNVDFGTSTSPPNYYTGVLSASISGGGQPVVRHKGALYGRFERKWDKDSNAAFAIPNRLVAFLRSALAFHVSEQAASGPGSNSTSRCRSSKVCGRCQILDYGDVAMECTAGKCVCPSAFYHLAVDPGVEADESVNLFSVTNTSEPCFTEPFWEEIQTTVYPESSRLVGFTTFVAGFVVSAFSITGTYYLSNLMIQSNLI